MRMTEERPAVGRPVHFRPNGWAYVMLTWPILLTTATLMLMCHLLFRMIGLSGLVHVLGRLPTELLTGETGVVMAANAVLFAVAFPLGVNTYLKHYWVNEAGLTIHRPFQRPLQIPWSTVVSVEVGRWCPWAATGAAFGCTLELSDQRNASTILWLVSRQRGRSIKLWYVRDGRALLDLIQFYTERAKGK